MTTPDTRGAAPRPSGPELPVWQLEGSPVEPYASMEELDPDGLMIDDGAGLDIDSRGHQPVRTAVRPQRANPVTVLLALSAMVALGGVSFAIGRTVSAGGSTPGQATVVAGSGPTTGGNGLPGPAPNPGGVPLVPGGEDGAGVASGTTTVSGTVVGVSSNSITVQQANGQTVTIATDASTGYHSQTSATSASVTTGTTVIVQTSGRTGFSRERGGISAGASPGLGVGRATSVTVLGQ